MAVNTSAGIDLFPRLAITESHDVEFKSATTRAGKIIAELDSGRMRLGLLLLIKRYNSLVKLSQFPNEEPSLHWLASRVHPTFHLDNGHLLRKYANRSPSFGVVLLLAIREGIAHDFLEYRMIYGLILIEDPGSGTFGPVGLFDIQTQKDNGRDITN